MNIKHYALVVLIFGMVGIFLAAAVDARPRASVKTVLNREENPRPDAKNVLVLPYVFSTEDMGFTMGVGGGAKGFGQEQLLFGATGFGSVDNAVGFFAGIWDFRPSFVNRLFLSARGMVGHYPNQRAYTARSFEPDTPRPGSNDSDADQYGQDSGYDNWSDLRLEFVLPMGAARNDALQRIRTRGGLLQSDPIGGDTWNPLAGGVTTLLLRQFNRYRSFELDDGDVDATTHPLEFAVYYDNTDHPVNPSRGSSQYLSISQDFGWLESPDEWTFVEFEAAKYFSLGDSNWARQRIVALNFWTGDSPSWDEETREDGRIVVTNRPPFYEGATLGGFDRMRAYPVDRFNDRSVIYATAEYRYTLDWNPIGNISWLRWLQSDWMQLVGFVEGGRVANEYDISTLFEDWQMDAGFGLRFMLAGAVVRVDAAFSDESNAVWVMLGQPF
jgi:hypothetical protein